MKHTRLWAAVGAFTLLAGVAFSASAQAKKPGEPVFSGGSYLIIFRNGTEFASRAVITLHADRTISVVDSGQQGPANDFTSQLGAWKLAGSHRIVGRTIDFNYPVDPNGPALARLDFVIKLSPDRRHVMGTATLTAFPLQDSNPFADGGTPLGTFTFGGERIEP
jgi:hypothetical protein